MRPSPFRLACAPVHNRHTPGRIRFRASSGPGPGDAAQIGQVACGDHHTVLLATDGSVYSFGFGGYGRLGHRDQKDCYEATRVDMPHKVAAKAIAAGSTCTYAVASTGALFFWGRTKSTGEATMYPRPVTDLRGWKVRALAAGHTSTVVAADRSVVAWGPSPTYGELGYGPEGPKSSTVPKIVEDLEGAAIVACAATYAGCVLVASDAPPADAHPEPDDKQGADAKDETEAKDPAAVVASLPAHGQSAAPDPADLQLDGGESQAAPKRETEPAGRRKRRRRA